MNSSRLENYRILRPLEFMESAFDQEMFYGNFILPVMFLADVDESIEAKITMALLKKTALIWIQKNPLLNANIWRPFDLNKPSERKLGPTRYFVCRESIDLNNIQLEENDNTEYWKEVMEIEMATLFDLENGPLWRIRVIKSPKKDSDKIKQFAFIYTTHHALGDGRNAFSILTQYIDILSNLIIDENYQGEDIPVNVPGKNMKEYIDEYRTKDGYKSYIEKIDYKQKCKKLSSKTGNKNAENKTKFECFKIEKPMLDKLIAKMKEKAPKAKLTSTLNAIIAISMRHLYDKYQVDDIEDIDNAQFRLPSSLRTKFNIPNLEMGSFTINLSFNFNTKGLNEENFWPETEKLSLGLHRRIEHNEEIEEYLTTIDMISNILNSDYNFLDFVNSEFFMSNRGSMTPSRSNIIICKEHYFAQPYITPRVGGVFFNGVTTINGTLCWSLSFNIQLHSNEFVKDLIKSLINFIDCIINS